VGSADVSFLCPRNSGAVLSLPVAARREDTLARGDFAKWITSHIDSWFAFTRRRGLGIEKMEDIILVTGRHRTRSWTNIAFHESQANAQVSFSVQVTEAGTASGVNWQVERRNIHGAMLSQGPSGVVCGAEFSRTYTESSDVFRYCRTYLRINAYLSEDFA
jgi:hypothetical protein